MSTTAPITISSTKEKEQSSSTNATSSYKESRSNVKEIIESLVDYPRHQKDNLSLNEGSNTNNNVMIGSSLEDDSYIENVLNASDRRASWQKMRSQRSYLPSLSAICKYI